METQFLHLDVIVFAAPSFLVAPEPVEDQDIFGNQLADLLRRKRPGHLVVIALGAVAVPQTFSADALDQVVAPHGHLNVAPFQVRIDFVDILCKQHGRVLALAAGTNPPGHAPLVVADVDHPRLHHLDVLVHHVIGQPIACRIAGTVGIRPLGSLDFRQLAVPGQQVIGVGQGGNLRNDIHMMLPRVSHQFGDFFFFQHAAVGKTHIAGILKLLVRSGGPPASGVFHVLGKVNPSRIQFRVAVKLHPGVHFNNQPVQLRGRHHLANKSLEVRNVPPAGQKDVNAPKRFVGPIDNPLRRDGNAVAGLFKNLTERLQPVISACRVASDDGYTAVGCVQHVAFRPRSVARSLDAAGLAILPHQRIRLIAHQDKSLRLRNRGRVANPDRYPMQVGQFSREERRKKKVGTGGQFRHQDHHGCVHLQATALLCHFTREREDHRIPRVLSGGPPGREVAGLPQTIFL